MNSLTDEQLAAAEFKRQRLLVSAAAGSGKTRLLVSRVIGRIERERLDLEDFLIITFTRAAAAELRDRFGAELSARAAETGDRHLLRQVTASRQNITTIDSLCQAIVRENSHLSDLAGFRIASEGELELMRSDALASALERIYSSADSDSDVAAMCEALGYGRADRKISDAVTALYDSMRAHPFPEQWAEQMISEYDKADFADTGFGAELCDSAMRLLLGGEDILRRALNTASKVAALNEAYAGALKSDLSCARSALAALGRHDLTAAADFLALPDARLSAVRGSSFEKEQVKSMRDAWKGIKKRAAELLAGADECTAELRILSPAVRGLFKAAAIFGEEFGEVKRLRRSAEFDDFSHEAVRLLASPLPDGGFEPSETARTVGARFREVLVDEFQDTNEIQSFLCRLLTAGEGQTLFMVGDVKQSIYRFRLARPEIFLSLYKEYPPIDAGAPEARQSLTRNFRSRAEVLDVTNYFFRRLMDGGSSEILYDEEQRLSPARPDSPNAAYDTELCIVGVAEEAAASADAQSAEAAYVASRAKEMLDGRLLIPDGHGGTRVPRPEDIAVLLRAAGGRGWMYRQAFENLGIPCGSVGESDVSAELLALLSILTAVDNPYLDVPLVGAMLSPVFGFTPDEVAFIRAASGKGMPVYRSVKKAASEGNVRAQEFLSRLETFRRESGKTSPDRFLLYLYAETGIVGIYSALTGGAARRERLNRAYMKARSYAASSNGGLHGFVMYLESAIERGEIASGGGDNGVRIMSVHKSKGLEFPIVFYSALTTRFNFTDTRGDLLCHPDLGVGLRIYDRKKRYVYPSGAFAAISERMRRETLAEELRILYVAMTRAKEKLILTCAYSNPKAKVKKMLSTGFLGEFTFVTAQSPADWLIPLAAEHPDGLELRAASGSSEIDPDAKGRLYVHFVNVPGKNGSAGGASEPDGENEAPDEALVDEISRRLEYRYPGEVLREIPSKLTATQLKGLRGYDEEDEAPAAEDAEDEEDAAGEGPEEHAAKYIFRPARPRLISGDTGLSPAERGTALHTVMQFARLEELTTTDGALREIDRLEHDRFITPEQAKAARDEAFRLCAFVTSPLGQRAIESGTLRREFKFSVLDDAVRYFPTAPDGEKVLLQGVCDLFFEENGGITVVDFKSDRISAGKASERARSYAPQLDAYARALSRIFGLPVLRRVIWFFSLGREEEVPAL